MAPIVSATTMPTKVQMDIERAQTTTGRGGARADRRRARTTTPARPRGRAGVALLRSGPAREVEPRRALGIRQVAGGTGVTVPGAAPPNVASTAARIWIIVLPCWSIWLAMLAVRTQMSQ